jgi:hypothetical protein
VLQAIGYALWTIAPSYPSFAAGFALWGIEGALRSGALEALVYEELDRAGAASRYAHVNGRAAAIGTLASTLAIALAAPLLAIGGFSGVGAASVLACLASAVAAAALPEHRSGHDAGAGSGWGPYAGVLADGIAEVRSRRALRGALLVVPAVSAIWGALDEYLPLLAADTGVRDQSVPLLFLVVYVGVGAGGVLGAPAARLSRRALARLVAAAAAALAAGAISGRPSGFVLIAVAFCAFQAVTIVVDARLQDSIAGRARSTVTSLAALATEVVVLGVYAGYGAGSAIAGNATLFAGFAACYLAVAIALRRSTTSAPSTGRPKWKPWA